MSKSVYVNKENKDQYYSHETGSWVSIDQATDFNNWTKKMYKKLILPKGAIGVRYYSPDEWQAILDKYNLKPFKLFNEDSDGKSTEC